MTDLEQRFAELARRLDQVEENQRAIDGGVRAFITVFAIRRLPEESGDEHDAETGG